MNKIREKLKKAPDATPDIASSTPGASSLNSESDSLKELRPMFVSHSAGNFTNDLNLNLNPSISDAESSVVDKSSRVDSSLFSSRMSHSTRQSSHYSNANINAKSPKWTATDVSYGQILETREDISGSTGSTSSLSPINIVVEKLHVLWQDISHVSNQYSNSDSTLSSTVINIMNCFKDFMKWIYSMKSAPTWEFDAYNNSDVRKILKTYLHFYDNLLQEDAYVKLRLLLCKTFNDFNATLKITGGRISLSSHSTLVKPCNFTIGVNDGKAHDSEDSIKKVMDKIASYNAGVKEQNGSFIAPITRGISKNMNVLCLYFGYRVIEDHHSRIAANIQELYDDVHVIVAKNRIELASAAVASMKPDTFVTQDSMTFTHTFKPPFRIPLDSFRPPMSLSLSTETSTRVSGTMGGFIYPIIDKETSPHLQSYANSKFALSCGHVCLGNTGEGTEYPYISSPSAVLIGLYKNALIGELDKFNQNGSVSGLDSRVAYSSIINQLDGLFPAKKVKTHDQLSSKGVPIVRNLPKVRFGQIIWGERTLIREKAYKDGQHLEDKRLSDLAIIKVNKTIRCDQNYLGDDVAFSEHDPALMFDNLYVRKILDLRRYSRENPFKPLNETDSKSGDSYYTINGTPVFKYGSTTKFTRGNINGIKLVYWMDGAIHSSEFVVNSAESTTAFAAGGDSGAWILTKLEDVTGISEAKGLGVVGMLHSYDGEFRQFGLFTPMTEILDRLEEVTKIKWGVVGVPEKATDFVVPNDSSDSEGHKYTTGTNSDSDSDSDSVTDSDDDNSSAYESFVDEQAHPPDIV